ncbi:hypothetical protein [Paenibacillus ginsengarvi]|uniref:Uncharacterized protein n=1 Tax=Paenibacillus ginsengarvi TaxID=400777 RepID=A0A3B0CMY2_9BACL|nr:hypothetical protein [Paenibacillus ginsengarvi]RKN86753.1 hypothetical protein D7M11_02000 [Paenibacillus ginsengarvi]
MEDKGRKTICECVECKHRQAGWSGRDGACCELCGGHSIPVGWWDDIKSDNTTNQTGISNFTLRYEEAPALVFVQKNVNGGIEVYQDGVRLEGVCSIEIKSEMNSATTHKVEYMTGMTRSKRNNGFATGGFVSSLGVLRVGDGETEETIIPLSDQMQEFSNEYNDTSARIEEGRKLMKEKKRTLIPKVD